jgi:hypothetical protein
MKSVIALGGSAVLAGISMGLAAPPSSGQAPVACADTASLITRINDANTAGSGEIELVPGCTYAFDAQDGTSGDALPPITGKITIVGDNTTIMRSSDATKRRFRIFGVTETGELTLRGINVSTGSTEFDGGGILVDGGKLTLKKSRVTGNTSNADGGGIANEGGTVTLEASEVRGNVVLRLPSGNGDGGGISNNDKGTVYLRGSVVSDNTADEDGGGINNKGVLDVERSTISRNTARDDDGGGIDNAGALTLKRSQLVRNVAGRDGGAINNGEKGTITSTNDAFSDNKAGKDGAAINNEGKATLTRAEVTRNSAFHLGGGINNENDAGPASLTLDRSRVSYNRAGDTGGGINNAAGAAVDLENNTVIFKNQPNNCAGTVPLCIN